MLQLLKARETFANIEVTSDEPLTAEETGLADYKGYEVYNDLHYNLSEQYFGSDGNGELGNAYINDYMVEHYPNASKEDREAAYDAEYEKIQKAFEADVASGKIKIVITNDGKEVEVLDISQFNRNYDMSVDSIKEHKKDKEPEKIDGDPGGTLNSVVVRVDDKTIMLVEGSSKANDPDDWAENIMIGTKALKNENYVSVAYTDTLDYYDEMKARFGHIDRLVGNSQGGGSVIWVGMNRPEVEVLAINPSPQQKGTVSVNSNGNKNITIVYSDSDPLYNLTKMDFMGYETDIPGANIVHVDFGLDKLFAPDAIRTAELHAAHTGSVSAVDLNEDGKISDYEASLGIVIDDVIPRSVFTGEELGTGSSVTSLVMSKDSMYNFAEYLNKFHTQDIEEILLRNEEAIRVNEFKMDSKDSNIIAFDNDIMFVLEMFVGPGMVTIDVALRLLALVSTISLIGVSGLEASVNGFKAPKTEKFLDSVGKILRRFQQLTVKKIVINNITVPSYLEIKNKVKFFDQLTETTQNISAYLVPFDLVGHNGDYAIPSTLDGILKELILEENKLKDAVINLEACVKTIGDNFESTDQMLEKSISEGYLANQMTTTEERIHADNEDYIGSLELTENMNVIDQFENVVDNAVYDMTLLISEVLKQLVGIAEFVVDNKEHIKNIANFEDVVNEMEDLKDEDYGQTTSYTSQKDGYTTELTNTSISGMLDGVYPILSEAIDNYLRPNAEMLNTVVDNIPTLKSLVDNEQEFKQGILEYLKPSIETLMYDREDLGVVRDTLKLNSQVLYRMNREMIDAHTVLEGEVQFLGKATLKELVKELNLRISSLNTLHRDIFGDDSMDNIEALQ